MDIIKQYDRIGKSFIRNKRLFFSKKPDLAKRFILENVGRIKNKKILDVGCGGGDDALTYMKMDAKVCGIDSSKVMVAEARKNTGLGNNLRVESIEKTSFKSADFDVVAGRFSLHYLVSMDKAFREIHRLLKKGGKGVFVVDHPVRSFDNQKHRVYGSHEIVKIRLYNKKVPLSFPSHSFSDYLSSTFFMLFRLESIFEQQTEFEGEREKGNTPNFLGIVFRKK